MAPTGADWRGVAVTHSEATGVEEPEAELAGERDMGGEADAVGGAESDATEVMEDAVVPLGTIDGEGVPLAVAEKALEPLGDGEALGDDHGDGVALPVMERSLERDGASVSDESAVADAPEDSEAAAVEVGGALLAETGGDVVASEDDGEGLREKSAEAVSPREPVEVEEGVDSADGGGERVGSNTVPEGGALIESPALIECAAELEALAREEADSAPLLDPAAVLEGEPDNEEGAECEGDTDGDAWLLAESGAETVPAAPEALGTVVKELPVLLEGE